MTQNIPFEPRSATALPVARTAATGQATRRWTVDPSSAMQRSTARGRSAVQILGGAFVTTAEGDRAELRLDLAVDRSSVGPTTLELVSRSIERCPDGSLRFTMSGALTVDGESIATEMVLRDCSPADLHVSAWASISGTTVPSPGRRRLHEAMSLDLLLVPVAVMPASRAHAA
jgi:hypothetical protein